ncbi:hypothetical protein S100390_v1c03970 [Spiroplasma sp. NBRC 100390]|uniref:hypothetical protein n=1 Tax=unclassified Spiroplasma TaxID=2637901 RepID=UPI000892826A|nr:MULTISPECIES: hypothetical protein [unclassified Spiroplasma]AOX43740.1 hypothetical protein STU14_v1c03970 [Spiroplasma sp. TU-14]APE13210.1 hypothetical protein S100390_v1c03970 [Spiroplasma sp. NBRC 100390]
MDEINNTLNFIDKRINSIFAPLIKKEIKNSELYNTKIAAELLKRIEYLDSKNTVILNWILQLSDIDINEANEPNETNKDLWLRDPDFLNELYEELKITYDKWIKKRVTKFDITFVVLWK